MTEKDIIKNKDKFLTNRVFLSAHFLALRELDR